MSYVRCINNKAYLHFKDEPQNDEDTSLTIGHIYKTLPATSSENEHGWLRVIDDTGEDYLFPANYFEPITFTNGTTNGSVDGLEVVTLRLDPLVKGILRAEALAAKKPMSALVREWIDDHLDLPI